MFNPTVDTFLAALSVIAYYAVLLLFGSIALGVLLIVAGLGLMLYSALREREPTEVEKRQKTILKIERARDRRRKAWRDRQSP